MNTLIGDPVQQGREVGATAKDRASEVRENQSDRASEVRDQKTKALAIFIFFVLFAA